VHRIDKETSGLVVLARTAEAESKLGKQFRAHTIGRRYLALVRGQAKDARIESHLVADRGDGRRGSGKDGQLAVTHVRVVERLGDFSLVECELETGRTHQVRIHLGEAGIPLCGERLYDRPPHGRPLPDASGANRPMLHAAYLALDHPATGKRMEWHSKLPRDMAELMKRLKEI
jgi:23S rRNA pseudouridine1911/1915/1917 synthase